MTNNEDMLYEERVDGEVRFEGKIINVFTDRVRLANGKIDYREVIRKNGGVCVVPVTEEGEIVFVNQYRYAYGKVVREVPAGKMEKDEDPLLCGLRELSEETGYTAKNVVPLGVFYPSPGIMDEILYMYYATDLTLGETHPDEDEFVTVERIPFEKAVDMVLGGEIVDGKTQTAVLKAWALRQKGEL